MYQWAMIKYILKSLDLVHSTIVSVLFQKMTDILNQLSVIQNTPFLWANLIFIKKKTYFHCHGRAQSSVSSQAPT